jgi:hypothetical protein
MRAGGFTCRRGAVGRAGWQHLPTLGGLIFNALASGPEFLRHCRQDLTDSRVALSRSAHQLAKSPCRRHESSHPLRGGAEHFGNARRDFVCGSPARSCAREVARPKGSCNGRSLLGEWCRRPRRRVAWSREELLVAFRLYCRTTFGRLHRLNPEIIELARLLGRTPSAVGMKACNFAGLDPVQRARHIWGLGNVVRVVLPGKPAIFTQILPTHSS